MPDEIKILTCNIRCVVEKDGHNNWPHRKGIFLDVIANQNADIICFQELTQQQEVDVTRGLPDYDSYGIPDEPTGENSVNRIFYRDDRFSLIAAGGYWLSITPHVAGSRSWDSAYIRLANWVRLRDCASGNTFRVVNTHLDCDSQTAREGQANCIVEDAQAYPSTYPQILTGDMNADVKNAAISIFKQAGWRDTYGAIHGTEDPGNTHHDFLGPAFEASTGKIDWIFMRGNIECLQAEIVTDAVDGRYPSDHYFVSAVVNIGDQPPEE